MMNGAAGVIDEGTRGADPRLVFAPSAQPCIAAPLIETGIGPGSTTLHTYRYMYYTVYVFVHNALMKNGAAGLSG